MNTEPHDNLEAHLRQATTWTGPDSDLWQRALAHRAPEAGGMTTTATSKASMLSLGVMAFARRRWFALTAVASAACLALVLTATMNTRMGAVGERAEVAKAMVRRAPLDASPEMKAGRAGESVDASPSVDAAVNFSMSPATQTQAPTDDANQNSNDRTRTDMWQTVRESGESPKIGTPSTTDIQSESSVAPSGRPSAPVASPRFVISKATLELTTPDVRAAFLKAGLVVNEALGEYVQDSSLTGSGDTAYGSLTLRVTAERLPKVLNDLRDLGVVAAERREGQDVTAQVVDLDARLRNERRVEQELLALFDQRKDAPLKDVLDLRQKIAEVRSGIEQLVGQRDQLGRLVSLATILVIIRTDAGAAVIPHDGLWQYFGDSIARSWRWGLRCLSDTLAGALALLVGGLVWWLLLATALLMLRRYVKRRASQT